VPQRTFRVVVDNDTGCFTLKRTFDHLCHGVWASDELTPPEEIAPGASAEMQSESDGFMTGTEGYVKYDVVSGADRLGMVYVYWENPFYGTIRFRFECAPDDVEPDCDFDKPSGAGLSRSAGDCLPFKLSFKRFSYTTSSEEIRNVGNLGELVVFAGAGRSPSLFGWTGIVRDPVLNVELTEQASGFSSSASDGEPVALEMLVDATAEQWVGNWGDRTVAVKITESGVSERPLMVRVYDGSTNPMLAFGQNFAPGPKSFLVRENSALRRMIDIEASNSIQRSILTSAVTSLIEQGIALCRGTPTPSKCLELLSKSFPKELGAISPIRQGALAKALAKLLRDAGAVAHLDNDTILCLYGEFRSGRQVGRRLGFLRFDAWGGVVTSAMLKESAPAR